MPKSKKFRQPRTAQVVSAPSELAAAQKAEALRRFASGTDIAQRAAFAWGLVAARRSDLTEFEPGVDPWGALEMVRDAAECGDLPDALAALRGAAADWLAALAPAAEWEGNDRQGLAYVRGDSRLVLYYARLGRLALAEAMRRSVRAATYEYRTAAHLANNPDLYPPRYVRLASDWGVWCRRARCALVWLHAAEGSAPPKPADPSAHYEPEAA